MIIISKTISIQESEFHSIPGEIVSKKLWYIFKLNEYLYEIEILLQLYIYESLTYI